jgi:hypothetical protein
MSPREFKTSIWLPLAIVLVSRAVITAAPVTFGVNCNGGKVGTVSVDTMGAGISGGFTSSVGGPPNTLAAAATACGEDHFDWYQIVTAAPSPPKDANGNQLTVPWVDPPPGGYQGGDWQDNLPWYWNETLGPGEKATELSMQTTIDTLKFADFPSNKPGAIVMFLTWLVSLNADSSFHAWEGGFSWTYTEGSGVSNIASLGAGVNPTDAQYKDIIGGFASKTPEPSPWILICVGSLVGMKYFRRARKC